MHHWLDLKLTPQHTLLSSRPSLQPLWNLHAFHICS